MPDHLLVLLQLISRQRAGEDVDGTSVLPTNAWCRFTLSTLIGERMGARSPPPPRPPWMISWPRLVINSPITLSRK